MVYENSLSFAKALDQADSLRHFRKQFYIPEKEDKPVIYFCGNSLGLQPKSAESYIQDELKKWADDGVEGHFTGDRPWVSYHNNGRKSLARLVGSLEHEVVAMNNLTTNLHLMLASFYDPTGDRVKLIIEAGAFPSDHFAVTSHMRMKGIDPNEHLIELAIPDHGYLDLKTIKTAIETVGTELALIMLPGVQYYTGQFFDIKKITSSAHNVGAFAGFDLAHAAGNIPMTLHDDNVDFAIWCSYKYLNSGPGNVSGAFIHEKHGNDASFPRLAGWWGQDESIRFKMENKFQPMKGIDGWMLSNVNIISSAAHLASLELFDKAGIYQLREKSIQLTGYLSFLISSIPEISKHVTCLTPDDPAERGCQLSLFIKENGKQVFDYMTEKGVIMDWREPNVIRIAPTPLYNTYEEVQLFSAIMSEALIHYD
jgi:kynureninase